VKLFFEGRNWLAKPECAEAKNSSNSLTARENLRDQKTLGTMGTVVILKHRQKRESERERKERERDRERERERRRRRVNRYNFWSESVTVPFFLKEKNLAKSAVKLNAQIVSDLLYEVCVEVARTSGPDLDGSKKEDSGITIHMANLIRKKEKKKKERKSRSGEERREEREKGEGEKEEWRGGSLSCKKKTGKVENRK